ncbi:uncharacterized protein EAF01_004651 [Botrytis porri]|uniref:Uncharacterized protein n=1 Tax=Botrytis porri TaxID=87229 RepID=A0A4Z1KQ78_9HELO|nr:uncharacterized protein EAF01_004651 [Botrytis porri]KAF7907064.1 hypothetical protein EAF01_004651 [Botrytis porri]TGO83505.1 hypothetical protein BPOR_0637g00040 [Botrytis porri]
MDISDISKALITVSAMIIDTYTQTIKMHTMDTKLLAAIDEDGLPLIRHGPERQELQSLQKYSFVVTKIAMAVFAILGVIVGVVLFAGIIHFVSTLSTR